MKRGVDKSKVQQVRRQAAQGGGGNVQDRGQVLLLLYRCRRRQPQPGASYRWLCPSYPMASQCGCCLPLAQAMMKLAAEQKERQEAARQREKELAAVKVGAGSSGCIGGCCGAAPSGHCMSGGDPEAAAAFSRPCLDGRLTHLVLAPLARLPPLHRAPPPAARTVCRWPRRTSRWWRSSSIWTKSGRSAACGRPRATPRRRCGRCWPRRERPGA